MEQTIYKVYSFESNEWVECDKYTYDKTEDKYRDWEAVSIPEPFRQPNRFDLMSETEKAIEGIRRNVTLDNQRSQLSELDLQLNTIEDKTSAQPDATISNL
jgi:hypothetical protein